MNGKADSDNEKLKIIYEAVLAWLGGELSSFAAMSAIHIIMLPGPPAVPNLPPALRTRLEAQARACLAGEEPTP